MTVGDRINYRRKQLGISAETIASRLGVSPGTVYRYENSEIMNMRSDKLGPIADILLTTPAYLMGWTDDPEAQASAAPAPNGTDALLETLRRSPGRRTLFSLTKDADEKQIRRINRVIEALIGTDDDPA